MSGGAAAVRAWLRSGGPWLVRGLTAMAVGSVLVNGVAAADTAATTPSTVHEKTPDRSRVFTSTLGGLAPCDSSGCAQRAGITAAAEPTAASAPQWVSWSVAGAKGSVDLRAWWSPAASGFAGDRPAVVMLHGCGGMLNKAGEPSARMHDYARLLNAQGWHTLAVDSLTPRGETELCTQKASGRRVKVSDRALDALAALDWLARQPGVDASRLALLGWSNGGSTLLAATNARHVPVAQHFRQSAGQLKLAVAFYPGCLQVARRGYQAVTDTWLLLGEADDWTPAAECTPLASERVHIRSWSGAGHGFDGTAPVRLRTDVPNGAHPGQGVHVGGQPQARAESRALLVELLTQAFAIP